MTKLSLGQAAKLAGVGKTTISRAISSGRLAKAGLLERLFGRRAA